MRLNNIIIFQGSYVDVKEVRSDLQTFQKNKKLSKYYQDKTTKYIKKLVIAEEVERNYQYELKIHFEYPKTNLEDLIKVFDSPNLTVAHMCYSDKKKIWIVNNENYIKEFKLMPEFAIHQILLDYMHYKESSIILDSFETIKYDQNERIVVVNDKKLNYDEIIDLIYNKTIKGKPFIDILEQFIQSYHHKCINRYDDIYSINKEENSSEEPSPFSLFIVTFGIIAILFILIKLMGYF